MVSSIIAHLRAILGQQAPFAAGLGQHAHRNHAEKTPPRYQKGRPTHRRSTAPPAAVAPAAWRACAAAHGSWPWTWRAAAGCRNPAGLCGRSAPLEGWRLPPACLTRRHQRPPSQRCRWLPQDAAAAARESALTPDGLTATARRRGEQPVAAAARELMPEVGGLLATARRRGAVCQMTIQCCLADAIEVPGHRTAADSSPSVAEAQQPAAGMLSKSPSRATKHAPDHAQPRSHGSNECSGACDRSLRIEICRMQRRRGPCCSAALRQQ